MQHNPPPPFTDDTWSLNACIARHDQAHALRVANEIRAMREQQENLYFRDQALNSTQDTLPPKQNQGRTCKPIEIDPDTLSLNDKSRILVNMNHAEGYGRTDSLRDTLATAIVLTFVLCVATVSLFIFVAITRLFG